MFVLANCNLTKKNLTLFLTIRTISRFSKRSSFRSNSLANLFPLSALGTTDCEEMMGDGIAQNPLSRSTPSVRPSEATANSSRSENDNSQSDTTTQQRNGTVTLGGPHFDTPLCDLFRLRAIYGDQSVVEMVI